MATANDTARRPAGKPAPIPCTVLSGEPLNGSLAVDGEDARVALDILGGSRCIHLVLDPDTALDLALRLIATVTRHRRAAGI
jgi:hypothetical protein